MTRISTFAIATLAAIAATSLASTGASAHGGGHAAAGGFSGPAGHTSPAGNYAHAPVAVGSFGRSQIVPRLVGGHNIPTVSQIAKFPVRKPPPPPPTTNTNNNPKPGWGSGGWGGAVGVVSVDVATDNCLIKQYLPNGRVLFKDICTRETALSR